MLTVVVGNTRSGSSLMMQTLAAAGMKCNGGDAEHPYYEDSRMLDHSMRGDFAWLADHEDGAVKLLDPHRYWTLPVSRDYRFLFMVRRDVEAQARSAMKMGKAIYGSTYGAAVRKLKRSFREDVLRTRRLLPRLGPVLEVKFEDIISFDNSAVSRIADFLGLDRRVLEDAHKRALVPRSAECLPYVLENTL